MQGNKIKWDVVVQMPAPQLSGCGSLSCTMSRSYSCPPLLPGGAMDVSWTHVIRHSQSASQPSGVLHTSSEAADPTEGLAVGFHPNARLFHPHGSPKKWVLLHFWEHAAWARGGQITCPAASCKSQDLNLCLFGG